MRTFAPAVPRLTNTRPLDSVSASITTAVRPDSRALASSKLTQRCWVRRGELPGPVGPEGRDMDMDSSVRRSVPSFPAPKSLQELR